MAADNAKPKPKPNPIVRKIVKNPKSPPNALCLRGFVGDSSEEKSIRLYFDPSFSDYVDIPEDAILHSEPVPEAWSPFGAMYVWIERDAELMHGSERIKANFMQGRIFQQQAGAQAAAPQAQAGPVQGGPGGLQITPTPPFGCPNTPFVDCPPTPPFLCQTPPPQFCPPTPGPFCQTPPPQFCPPTPGPFCQTPFIQQQAGLEQARMAAPAAAMAPGFGGPQDFQITPFRTPFLPCITQNYPFCPTQHDPFCPTQRWPFCQPAFGQGSGSNSRRSLLPVHRRRSSAVRRRRRPPCSRASRTSRPIAGSPCSRLAPFFRPVGSRAFRLGADRESLERRV